MSSGIQQHKYAVALLEQQLQRKKRNMFIAEPYSADHIMSILDLDSLKMDLKHEKRQLTWLGRTG